MGCSAEQGGRRVSELNNDCEKPVSCSICDEGEGLYISDLSGLASGFLLLRQLMTLQHQGIRCQWKTVILSFGASCLALSELNNTLKLLLQSELKPTFLMHQTTVHLFVLQNLFGQCLRTTWKLL